VEKNHSYFFDDDLNMILKYSGKTNEIFTRMTLNLAVLASGYREAFLDSLFILDPICGKGTAVFEALICGYNAFGLDINKKQIEEASQFFKKYLENGKYKHSKKEEKFSGTGFENTAFKSTRHLFDIAKNKADQKENIRLVCEFTDGDTRDAGKYYKKETFHIIAGDLAYGVQHENSTGKNKARNPAELIETSLPAWIGVLKPKGALALSWNTYLLKREQLEAIFAENKLTLVDFGDFGDFSHRVDQAINRDLIIGAKN
jgi:tRNA G10  N-methylase Trm11